MLKNFIKNILLDTGLYYKINNRYSEHSNRYTQQKKFYEQHISKNDIVFDIGANVGQRSWIFSNLAQRVIAVEPQPFCQRHLKSRFKFVSNVVIEPIGLDKQPGTAILYESDSHTLSSMNTHYIDTVKKSTFKNNTWDKKITITTSTLDNLIDKHGLPSFIKIDVEGFEHDVLLGLTKKPRMISFEFNPAYIQNTILCIQRIISIDYQYKFNYCKGEDLNFVLKDHFNFSEFLKLVEADFGNADFFGDIYAILI